MKYTVKKICEKSDIKKCENFVIDKYMWNSTQEPKTYGWLGYLENKGFFVKMVCEEQIRKGLKQSIESEFVMIVRWKYLCHL